MEPKQKPAVQQHQRWEQDERWTAVDEYAIASLSHKGSPDELKLLSALQYSKELSNKTSLPTAEVSFLQGRFLRLQCMLLNAKNVLEVGTLSGYSAIWLASTSSEIKVTTIELEQWNKVIAEQAIENACMADRVEVFLGAGKDVMFQVRKETEAGQREKFDFVVGSLISLNLPAMWS